MPNRQESLFPRMNYATYIEMQFLIISVIVLFFEDFIIVFLPTVVVYKSI